MKKVMYSGIMIVLLLLYPAVYAFAAEPLTLHVEGYSVKDNAITVYCNTNLSAVPTNNELTLSIGNTNLPIKEIKEFSSVGQGASIIFLADVSGSISKSKLQSIKDTLNLLVDQMGKLDNVSVLTVGDEAYTQPFVSDREKIKTQISSIKGMSENTNLYLSITKALDILSTNDSNNTKKCIVILSDGEDYGIKGITREEVNKKIEERNIPIYTIAMLDPKPAERYVQTSKILGSFARLSPGGIDYIHELDKASSSKIAEGIKASIDKSIILTADLSDFKSEGNEMYMKLELSVSGKGKTNDGYNVATGGFSTPPKEPEVASSEKKLSTGSLFLFIGIPLCIIILVTIIVINKRKKAAKLAEIKPEVPSSDEDKQPEVEVKAETSQPIIEPKPVVEKTPDAIITLTKVGLIEEQVYNLELKGELVLGRDPSKSGLSFPEDDLLSSKHCAILYDSGNIILKDLKSTNGTYVNGVPIKDTFKLEKDDVLLIGSMELRINW